MKSPLPTYSLYGDQGRTFDVDWLHCESIAERSRLHDWEIRPHRHELLFQLFWIEQGACSLTLDSAQLELGGPGVMLIPPPAVHGFRFEPDVQGQVVTVLVEHLSKLLAGEPALKQRLLQPRTLALDPAQARSVSQAIQTLKEEFGGSQDWRSMGVDSALARLLVSLGRCLQQDQELPAPQGSRALRHVQRYRALIEQRYRQQPALSAAAAEIGITSTQLNRVCQQVLGCTSIAVLHARLLLEAQRELAYTTMSLKQIAQGLGFADAAYFTRFFQRKTDVTPSEWRRKAAQRSR